MARSEYRRCRGRPHRHIAASNEGLIIGRPVPNAVFRLIRGMDLRLHPCSVAPAETRRTGQTAPPADLHATTPWPGASVRAMPVRQGYDAGPQRGIRIRRRGVPQRRGTHPHQRERPPFAHPLRGHVPHQHPSRLHDPGLGRSPFFSQRFARYLVVQHSLGQQLLQPRVLGGQRATAGGPPPRSWASSWSSGTFVSDQ